MPTVNFRFLTRLSAVCYGSQGRHLMPCVIRPKFSFVSAILRDLMQRWGFCRPFAPLKKMVDPHGTRNCDTDGPIFDPRLGTVGHVANISFRFVDVGKRVPPALVYHPHHTRGYVTRESGSRVFQCRPPHLLASRCQECRNDLSGLLLRHCAISWKVSVLFQCI
jgi:hypothetical protein